MPGGGSNFPPNRPETLEKRLPFIKMMGGETFKTAVRTMTDVCREVLRESGFTAADVSWMIPHQANDRIVQAVGERLEIPPERRVREHLPLREHQRRLHPDRARRVRPRGEGPAGRPDPLHRVRRRADVGRRARAMVTGGRAPLPRAGIPVRRNGKGPRGALPRGPRRLREGRRRPRAARPLGDRRSRSKGPTTC